MSCRSLSATSYATSFAHLNCDLSEVQTLSTFHALRSEAPAGSPAPEPEEYIEWLTSEMHLVRHHPNLSAARRASLLRRLDAALDADPVDGRTWYAMRQIRRTTQAQSRDLQARYAALAERLGVPVGRVRARAGELAAAAGTGRRGPQVPGYSPVSIARFRADRLPVDRGTIHALTVLESEAAAADLARQPRTEENRRITRTPIASSAIAEIGYDPDGGRLEIVFTSDTERVYAYRNVPAEVWAQFKGGPSAGRAWHRLIRGQSEYQYPDRESAELDGFRRQCASCGQFAASTHSCPPRTGTRCSACGRARQAGHACTGGQVTSGGLPGALPVAAAPGTGRCGTCDEPLSEQHACDPAAALAALMREDSPSVTPVTADDVAAFMAATTAAHQDRVREATAPVTEAADEPRSIDNEPRLPQRDPVNRVTTNAPQTRVLRDATATGPVSMSYRTWGSRDEEHGGDEAYQVRGRVVYSRAEDGSIAVDVRGLRCFCDQYIEYRHCPHIDGHYLALLRRVNPQAATLLDTARAQAEIEAAMRGDWMASKTLRAQALERVAPSPVLYTEDPARFEAEVEAAVQAAADADERGDVVGFVTENATGGLLTRESGRGFGVEIEFDFPEDMDEDAQERALQAIALDLYEAGLTSTQHQRDYHASEQSGYTDVQDGGWSFELDDTVAGEVVSPIMYDEPEAWENLAKVCEIIKRHGGRATTTTGSHVHIGAGDFRGDPAALTEVARLQNAHEDVLFRLGTHPDSETGEHRPLKYCGPSAEVPLAGYTQTHQAAAAHEGHHAALNLGHVKGEDDDHIEFRQWDGSLNPAVIQAQVKMSAAMTVAAKRISDEHGSIPRDREGVGSHHVRAKYRDGGSGKPLSAAERDAETASTRAFIDTVFTREEDKAQMARLFAVTRWSSPAPKYRPVSVAA